MVTLNPARRCSCASCARGQQTAAHFEVKAIHSCMCACRRHCNRDVMTFAMLVCALAASLSLGKEQGLLVPAPLFDAAMLHSIDLVAPPVVCANGQRPWAAGDTSRGAASQKRKREDKAGIGECLAGVGRLDSTRQREMDAWEMHLLQMMVMQALNKEGGQEALVLPPALACELCQMQYGVFCKLICLFLKMGIRPVPLRFFPIASLNSSLRIMAAEGDLLHDSFSSARHVLPWRQMSVSTLQLLPAVDHQE